MLKSCKYCGRVHDSKIDCGYKPKRQKHGNEKDKFRWSKPWQRKREEIKERDRYLCQVCIRNLYETEHQYNHEDLEVHHAIPLEEDFDRRLDNEILLTMCERHHGMAERGEIPRQEILDIITEQEGTPRVVDVENVKRQNTTRPPL